MKTIFVDAINAFVLKGKGMYEEMYVLLERYSNRKIVLTGANDEQMEQFGLNDLPYEVFTLKHDPEKSDPNYYRLVLKHYGLKPGDVVYFEHNDGAVKSARSVGIKTYFYDKDANDLVTLKKFIDENI